MGSSSMRPATVTLAVVGMLVLTIIGCGASTTDVAEGPDGPLANGMEAGVEASRGEALDASTVRDGSEGNVSDGGADDPCSDGTWDSDGDPSTACVPWTICGVGTHVAETPSATKDRTCAGCTSGTFSAATNAASCLPWSTCPAGKYVSTAGTGTGDRQCTVCPTGTFTSSANQSSCVPLGACAPGTVETVPATPTAPATCRACEVGSYCAGGAAAKVPCTGSKWDHDGDPSTACVDWTTCTAGSYQSSVGSATKDRACSACATGSYTTTTNQTSCAPWTTCTAGHRASKPGTATTNRVCSACTTGTFTTAATANNPSCKPWTDCPSGTYQASPGSTTANRQCTSCPSGQTSTGPNATECSLPPSVYDWSCVGAQPATTAADPISLSGRMQGLITGVHTSWQVVGGVTASVRLRSNDAQVATTVTPADGSVSLSLATAGQPLDAYVKFSKTGFHDMFFYPADPFHAANETVSGLLVDSKSWELLGALGLDGTNGGMVVVVRDCARTLIAGATISISPSPATILYPDPVNGMFGNYTSTRPGLGMAVAVGVPAGNVTISATADGRSLRAATVPSRANATAGTELHP